MWYYLKGIREFTFSLDFDDFFEVARTDRLCGHPFKLQRKRAHSDVRRNAFSHRVIGAWNGLPDAVVLSESVKSFKCRLDAHLLRTYCTYNHDCFSGGSLRLAHSYR